MEKTTFEIREKPVYEVLRSTESEHSGSMEVLATCDSKEQADQIVEALSRRKL